jgi:hypothetical protein
MKCIICHKEMKGQVSKIPYIATCCNVVHIWSAVQGFTFKPLTADVTTMLLLEVKFDTEKGNRLRGRIDYTKDFTSLELELADKLDPQEIWYAEAGNRGKL